MPYRKKLIEVALPLEAINQGSKPETENPFLKGHPRAIHNWWARTPLSVCRAILFAQLVDDPGESLPPEEAETERRRLLDLTARLATWEAISDERLLEEARAILRRDCGDPLPEFWDMFAGRGSIPLEAQRLGLRVTSSDLNPVAVTIQRVLLDYPSRFADQPPVNPAAGKARLGGTGSWRGAQGLADDVRYYGQWMQDEAERSIGDLYPQVTLPQEQGGGEATVIAWLWARTVKCPNPACGAQMPLVRSFALSTKKGKKAWVEPIVDPTAKTVRFEVRTGSGEAREGTVDRRGAVCVCCETHVPFDHVRAEGKAGRMGAQLMAIVAEGQRGRTYLPPSAEQAGAAAEAKPEWRPDSDLPEQALGFRVQLYGMTKHADLFTSRQLVALTNFCDLVAKARERVHKDALVAGLTDDPTFLDSGGTGAQAYADAVATYLACAVSRLADYCNSLCSWNPTNENVRDLFQRQAIPMVWDYVESNPMHRNLSVAAVAGWVADGLENAPAAGSPARVHQLDATKAEIGFPEPPVISTDPPYFDNIGYADLADFFYVWLRRCLKDVDPATYSTLLCPKEPELIVSLYRHDGSAAKAQEHFRRGFGRVFDRLYEAANNAYPMTVYYAFKEEEQEDDEAGNRVSTGWETMLEGLVEQGFQVTGTWPVRTTKKARSVARGTNALASAVVLVCRQRPEDAPMATRREFTSALRQELPPALAQLTHVGIAPVDLAQATIGPGMAVFSRYSKVLEADGSPMTVRTALQIINQELDAYLTEQEGDLDGDTRFCIAWFEQYGLNEGAFGEADVLARAKNTSVEGIEEAGVLHARAGKVRLRARYDYPEDWDPQTDRRLTVWECTQHLICELERNGEEGAAALVRRLGGGMSEDARALAYRLYAIADRKGWTDEARAYNGLVVSWPAIVEKAARGPAGEQGRLIE